MQYEEGFRTVTISTTFKEALWALMLESFHEGQSSAHAFEHGFGHSDSAYLTPLQEELEALVKQEEKTLDDLTLVRIGIK